MIVSLTACEPQGEAVGDSGKSNDIVHDGIDVNDIRIVVIGSSSFSLDTSVLDSCANSGMKASYVSISDIKNPASAAYDAISDASNSRSSLVIINEINVNSHDDSDSSDSSDSSKSSYKNSSSKQSNKSKSNKSKSKSSENMSSLRKWESALLDVRRAGIPVLLVNPIKPPSDTTLYAAKAYFPMYLKDKEKITKTIKNRNIKKTSLSKIVRAIIDNIPHEKEVIVDER
ncbi:hypothetical protein [uncultured Gardnerella sp.]|uniref:hypothetical protein n=1 Tax=uncultured Gardnerella sp. TaxID=293424 RepID=UPI0025EB0ADC|nr:hypothetical protein [uncultured Gardnerella sp.]